MTKAPRWSLLCVSLLPLWVGNGCVYTVAGTSLPPIQPAKPTTPPRVEYTVGDFAFTLEGGKLVTSHFIGKMLSDQLMAAWKERGYVSDAQFVETGAFTGATDQRLTLSGSQYGESSIFMQILGGLTLTLLPYSVTQHYDLQYVLEDVRSGTKYSASVQESDKAWVQLFLLFALPVGQRGHEQTVQSMGDHLYQQLSRQGAFQPAAGPP